LLLLWKITKSIPGDFIVDFQPHYGTGIDAASNRNEHQDYILGGKDDQCTGLIILLLSYADFLEILGVSTSMEPYRPLQARNGLALPLHVMLQKSKEYPAYRKLATYYCSN
jgi:hypothetical protein